MLSLEGFNCLEGVRCFNPIGGKRLVNDFVCQRLQHPQRLPCVLVLFTAHHAPLFRVVQSRGPGAVRARAEDFTVPEELERKIKSFRVFPCAYGSFHSLH